jgi:hypothetical protein
VNATDAVRARDNGHGPFNRAALDDAYDYNRDRLVNAVDVILARDNQTSPLTALRLITVPSLGSAVVEALAAPEASAAAQNAPPQAPRTGQEAPAAAPVVGATVLAEMPATNEPVVVVAIPSSARPPVPAPEAAVAMASGEEEDAAGDAREEPAPDKTFSTPDAMTLPEVLPPATGAAGPSLAGWPGANATTGVVPIPPPVPPLVVQAGSVSPKEDSCMPRVYFRQAEMTGPGDSVPGATVKMPGAVPGPSEGGALDSDNILPGSPAVNVLTPIEEPLAADVLAGLRLLSTR